MTAPKKRKLHVDNVIDSANIETLKEVTVDLAEELNESLEENVKLKSGVCVLRDSVKSQQQSKLKIKQRANTGAIIHKKRKISQESNFT